MISRYVFFLMLIATYVSPCRTMRGNEISVEGAPAEAGFEIGSVATIRATVKGVAGDARRYAVFAEIQYAGTTSITSVQMDRVAEARQGEAQYEVGWPIPNEAPTGVYTLALRVEDRTVHRTVALQALPGFAAYKKLVRISRLTLDKTNYNVGEPVQCEVTLENLTDNELKNLQVEFSNASYPWVVSYSGEAANAAVVLKVLRDNLTLPALGTATIPMMSAGMASPLPVKEKEIVAAGGTERHETTSPAEINTYTVAVWNADHTILYDMQFTTPSRLRSPGRDLTLPNGRSYTPHHNSYIDFTKYREVHASGQVSPNITVDRSRTFCRPGDQFRIVGTLKNTGNETWTGTELRVTILDPAGKIVRKATLVSSINLGAEGTQAFNTDAWAVPVNQAPGTYRAKLELLSAGGNPLAQADTEMAVDSLPSSVLVFCAHEGDEASYTGLIRAARAEGIPVHVVVLTGGEAAACRRYDEKLCGPNEAREFAIVRMEESREVLEHIGIPRDQADFLGLPDAGLGALWIPHIQPLDAYMSAFLACDHAPYEQVLKPNLPYARDPVLGALEQIITDFHPALIALPYPDDQNVDRRATNWLVIKACQDLLREKRLDPQTVIWADRVHEAGSFKPAPFKYEDAVVYLSGEAAALKQEMNWIYQSQDGDTNEGVKKTFSELTRQEEYVRILDWQEHEGWNE